MSPFILKLKKLYPVIDYKIKSDTSPSIYLFQKWAYKVAPKWYGFDMEGVPFTWAIILDKFLEFVKEKCPDFKIKQIKLKFGRCIIFLDLNSESLDAMEEVDEATEDLQNWLYHKDLVY